MRENGELGEAEYEARTLIFGESCFSLLLLDFEKRMKYFGGNRGGKSETN